MAIKKVMSANSKEAHRCIRCGRGKLGHLHDGGAAKCPKCGCIHLIKFTESGNLVLTDKDYSHLFERGKEDEQRV